MVEARTKIVAPASVVEVNRTARVEAIIGPAVERAANDPSVMALSADPAQVKEVTRAVATAMATDTNVQKRLDTGKRGGLTFAMLTAFGGAVYVTIELALGDPFKWEPVTASVGMTGLMAVPIVKRFFPKVGEWMESFFAK